MFRRVLVFGWTIFLMGMVMALVFPRQVLRHGALPTIILGTLLGSVTFIHGVVWAVRRRIKLRRS